MRNKFDKIQYLKNFSQEFLETVQEHFELVSSGGVSYFMCDKDDILDSLKECLNKYEKKENRESK